MLKTLAALGLSTALTLSAVAAFAQTTPAPAATPAASKDTSKMDMTKKKAKKHTAKKKTEPAPAATDAPKT